MSNKKLKYISLFSGIEAASVAWGPLGWEPIAFSEIEPYPCELLKQRFPDVPNLGDITKIDWSHTVEKQTSSLAGRPASPSASLETAKGSKANQALCLSTYARFAKSCRDTLSGRTCRERCRARRAQLSDSYCTKWMSSGTVWRGECWTRSFSEWPKGGGVSFLSDVLEMRDVPPRYFLTAKACAGIVRRAETRGKALPPMLKDALDAVIQCSFGADVPGGKGALAQDDIGMTDKNGPQGDGINEDLSFTLNTTDRHAVAYLPFNPTQVTSKQNGNNPQWDDPCHTISATDRPPHVICMADDNAKAAIDEDLCGTLKVGGEPPIAAIEQPPCFVVRKLMPIECERLQGFPDGWTDIEFKGKPASDAARYKALGNSMAVPVMHWIGKQIARFDA